MDKPAEGLASFEDGERFCLNGVEVLDAVDAQALYAFYPDIDKHINAAHASIVKPLRGKAERLEKNLQEIEEGYYFQLKEVDKLEKRQHLSDLNYSALERHYELSEVAKHEADKDRDAWKNKFLSSLKTVEDILAHEINPSNYDHDEVCTINNQQIEAVSFIRKEINAHLALKGKT